MEKFGERLAALRKQRGMSQEELAKKLQLTRQTISKWETGASAPDLESLVRLAELLNVSVDDMLGRETRSAAKKKADPFVPFFYIFLTVAFSLGGILSMWNHWLLGTSGNYSYAIARMAKIMIWVPAIIMAGIAVYKLILWHKTKK